MMLSVRLRRVRTLIKARWVVGARAFFSRQLQEA